MSTPATTEQARQREGVIARGRPAEEPPVSTPQSSIDAAERSGIIARGQGGDTAPRIGRRTIGRITAADYR